MESHFKARLAFKFSIAQVGKSQVIISFKEHTDLTTRENGEPVRRPTVKLRQMGHPHMPTYAPFTPFFALNRGKHCRQPLDFVRFGKG